MGRPQGAQAVAVHASEGRGEEAAVRLVGEVQAVPHALAADDEGPLAQPTDACRRGEVAPGHVAHEFPQAEPIQGVHDQVTAGPDQARGVPGEAGQVRQ